MRFSLLAAFAATALAGRSLAFVRGAKPVVNTWSYGDPALGCKTTEESIDVTGLPGDFCSPVCSQTTPCPTDYPPGATDSGTQGECVLAANGAPDATNCALICTPGAAGACGTGATCQPIQGVGVCTYPQ